MDFSKAIKNKKVIIISAIVIVLAMAAIIFICTNKKSSYDDLKDIDQNKYSIAKPRSDKPIIYIKNGALFAKASDGSGDAHDLSGSLCKNDIIETSSTYMDLVKQSKNAEYTYFVKDFSKDTHTGSLYATNDYQNSFLVDNDIVVESGYEYIKLSANGNTAVYMKNLTIEDNELYSDLYYKNTGDETSSEIASGLYGMQATYEISGSGKYIAAYSKPNPNTGAGGLIVLENKSAPKTIAADVNEKIELKSVTDSGKVIFTKEITENENSVQSSVCILDIASGEIKTFGKNVNENNIYLSDKSDKIVYVESEGSKIFAYSASFDKEPELITDQYCGFTGIDVENDCYIYATATGDEFYADKKKVYIKTPELSSPALLSDDIYLPSDVCHSADFKTIYYVSNFDKTNYSGTLYKAEIKNSALEKAEKLADNVHDFKISQGGNTVLFDTDYNKDEKKSNLKVYTKNDNKIKNIADSVAIDDAVLSVDGASVFYSDTPASDSSNNFTSALKTFDVYKDSAVSVVDEKSSAAYYYYDKYLASTSNSSINMRNRFYVRGEGNVLYYKDVSSDYKSAKLYLHKDKKEILVDDNVTVLLFE